MPMEAQTRLLRVLQEGEYTTVGGRTPDQDRRAHHRRHPPRPADADPAGPVPRGPVLPPQRRADPPAAAARARWRTSATSCGTSCAQAAKDGPRPEDASRPARDRAPEALPLAGQRARAGEPGPPARRALHPEEMIGADIIEAELAEAAPPPRRPSGERAEGAVRDAWSATSPATSPTLRPRAAAAGPLRPHPRSRWSGRC